MPSNTACYFGKRMLKPEWERGEKLRATLGGRLDISMGCICAAIMTVLQKVSGISEISFSIMPERYFYVLFTSQICPS